jgi:AraC family transcriptional activator of pyochelin receptor
MALIESNVPIEAMATYRLAKSIEILCEALKLQRDGELLPLLGVGGLSPADTRRVLEARRLIEERCGEKLTLTNIAKSCGLNRTKLTRGFRDLFNCSVAETLMAYRLERASHLLRTTDRPVACIGYETGYENNASFARAFGKRYGRTPTDYRTRVLAA